MGFLSAIAGFIKLLGVVFGLVQQNRDQTAGVELQKGADAEKANADIAKAVAARDAVVPDTVGPDGYRLPDGSRDPDQRD